MSTPSPVPRRQPATARSLIEGLWRADDSSWDRVVRMYAPLILHWCRRFGLQEADAADVTQEVFAAVHRGIASFRHGRAQDTFRGWLRRITVNKLRDRYRREAGDTQGRGGTGAWRALDRLEGSPPVSEESLASDTGEGALVRRALERIRPEFRETTFRAFWRTAVDACSAPDVARELGLSAGAVRVAKSRVLQRLRLELGDL
ncbi:MAG: sigma-70 family RNA polymerase sigma factor [Planctomycetota bacterium]